MAEKSPLKRKWRRTEECLKFQKGKKPKYYNSEWVKVEVHLIRNSNSHEFYKPYLKVEATWFDVLFNTYRKILKTIKFSKRGG